jgi:hypothetical protein
MIETLIIADDLTGAADCAVSCATAGADTVVLLDANADPGGATAVSVDVNSRARRSRRPEPLSQGLSSSSTARAHASCTTRLTRLCVATGHRSLLISAKPQPMSLDMRLL